MWSIPVSECARILAVAPLPSYSHQVAFRPIWKELLSRGHNITLITTDPINDPNLTNLTEIDIHDETYTLWRASGIIPLMQHKHKYRNLFSIAKTFTDVCSNLTKAIMKHDEVKKLLKDNVTFDLVMAEPFISVGFGFADWYRSKLILITSLEAPSYIHIAMGNPIHPVLYPESALPVETKTYLDRVFVTALFIFHYAFRSIYFVQNTNLLREEFGENTTSMEELLNRANMVFINVNPLFAGVRPLTPSTIFYGAGSHLEPVKPLPTVSTITYFINQIILLSLGYKELSRWCSKWGGVLQPWYKRT